VYVSFLERGELCVDQQPRVLLSLSPPCISFEWVDDDDAGHGSVCVSVVYPLHILRMVPLLAQRVDLVARLII